MTDEPNLYNSVAPLRNVAALLTLVDRLQNRMHGLSGMGVFHGRSGWGKTTAAIYATNKFRACHVQAMPFGGTKYLLTMIVTELGLKPARSIPELFAQAAKTLGDSGRPLLLDEADHLLTDKVIEAVRALHDQSGVPLILIGEEMLPQKLQRWERVHGRVLDWVGAEAATFADVGHLAPIYAPGIAVADDMRRLILADANNSIRYVSNDLDAVAQFARVRGLKAVSRAEWGNTPFPKNAAPSPRREAAPLATPRIGRVA